MKPHCLLLCAVVVLYAGTCSAGYVPVLMHMQTMQSKQQQPSAPSNKNSQSYLQSRKLNIQSGRAYSRSNIDNRYWDPNYNPNIPLPHIEFTVDESEFEAHGDEDFQPEKEDVLINSSDYLEASEQEMKQRELESIREIMKRPARVVYYG